MLEERGWSLRALFDRDVGVLLGLSLIGVTAILLLGLFLTKRKIAAFAAMAQDDSSTAADGGAFVPLSKVSVIETEASKCYLLYSATNNGSFVMHWSLKPLAGALAVYQPKEEPPLWQLQHNSGRTEIARCVAGNNKRICQAWAYFIKASFLAEGTFQHLAHEESCPIALWLLDAKQQVVAVTTGNPTNLEAVNAVAVVPFAMRNRLKVAKFGTRTFIEVASAVGAALALDMGELLHTVETRSAGGRSRGDQSMCEEGKAVPSSDAKARGAKPGQAPCETGEMVPGFEFGFVGEQPGIEMWRIAMADGLAVAKRMEVVAAPKLHEGDAYLVLQTAQRSPSYARLSWQVFYWLGESVSDNGHAEAVRKALELDERLGGESVVRREIQGWESEAFMELFRFVEYWPAAKQGSKRATYETRLLRVDSALSNRSARVRQVGLAAASLDMEGIFILALPSMLLQWNGRRSSVAAQQKGLEVAMMIRDEDRRGKADFIAFAQEHEPSIFVEKLGGRLRHSVFYPEEDQSLDGLPASDETPKQSDVWRTQPALFRVGYVLGSEKPCFKKVESAGLTQGMLDTNGIYLVQTRTELAVWVGSGVPTGERQEAIYAAEEYCLAEGIPIRAPLLKVSEGHEPLCFKRSFTRWREGSQRLGEPVMRGSWGGHAARGRGAAHIEWPTDQPPLGGPAVVIKAHGVFLLLVVLPFILLEAFGVSLPLVGLAHLCKAYQYTSFTALLIAFFAVALAAVGFFEAQVSLFSRDAQKRYALFFIACHVPVLGLLLGAGLKLVAFMAFVVPNVLFVLWATLAVMLQRRKEVSHTLYMA